MICPYCGSDQTSCKDSRQFPKRRWRRYRCLACGKAFTTHEIAVKRTKSRAVYHSGDGWEAFP